MSVDHRWYLDVNSFAVHTSWLHGFAAGYALWGGLVLLAAMLVGGYLIARRRAEAAVLVPTLVCGGFGVIVALLINQQIISPAVGRARPCHTIAHAEVLLSCAQDYSFPSDHCVLAGAFVAALFVLGTRWFAPAVVVALLLAFMRVYTGVHYPSDAGAGLLIGAAIGAVVMVLLRGPATRLASRLRDTPARALVVARTPERDHA